MRQILPTSAEVDPAEAHAALSRPAPPDRPWVLINMVASLDGATAVDGASGELGGPADRDVFRAIRAVADVIVAAAGTVRADGYGPPKTSPALQEMRVARGMASHPRIAVVSRSLDLDPSAPLFVDAPERTIVYTTSQDLDPGHADRAEALGEVAELVRLPGSRVEAPDIVGHLHGIGASRVLVEGGPSLNGAFLEAGLVDELDLTIAPHLVGGPSSRLATGAAETITAMRLAHLWEADDVLLGCWVRR